MRLSVIYCALSGLLLLCLCVFVFLVLMSFDAVCELLCDDVWFSMCFVCVCLMCLCDLFLIYCVMLYGL